MSRTLATESRTADGWRLVIPNTYNVWNMFHTFGQFSWYMQANTLQQTNIAMENGSTEDVCPIKNGDIPLLC